MSGEKFIAMKCSMKFRPPAMLFFGLPGVRGGLQAASAASLTGDLAAAPGKSDKMMSTNKRTNKIDPELNGWNGQWTIYIYIYIPRGPSTLIAKVWSKLLACLADPPGRRKWKSATKRVPGLGFGRNGVEIVELERCDGSGVASPGARTLHSSNSWKTVVLKNLKIRVFGPLGIHSRTNIHKQHELSRMWGRTRGGRVGNFEETCGDTVRYACVCVCVCVWERERERERERETNEREN